MSNIEYTPDYFIEFFAKIPDDKWTTGAYYRDECACAVGHLSLFQEKNYETDMDITLTFRNMFKKFLNTEPEDVNDNSYHNALPFTDGPKQRIIVALNLIKEKMNNER